MKILNCHIEGFGGIVNKDFSFDGKISSLVFENGYGKTTLASFIKAMLYGLESYKKNSRGFEDRQHFAPFSGARFGGSLTLVFRGTEYKIERFFDTKSQTKDTLRVYKNSKETDELTENVGEYIFGFDKDSFERLLFIKPDTDDYGSTPGIKAKLNHFVMDGGEISAATDALESAKKQLRAVRGNSGLISRENEKRLELIAAIKNLEILSLELDRLFEKKKMTQDTVIELELALKNKNEQKLREQVYKGYESLKSTESEIASKIKEITDKYPRGIPSEDELSELKAALLDIERRRAATDASSLSAQSRESLDSLSARFESNAPNESEIENMEELLKRSAVISSRLDSLECKSGDFTEKRRLPDAEELSSYKEKLAEYKCLCDECEALLEADGARRKSVKKIPLVFGILFLLTAIPLTFVHIALMAASAAIAALFLVLAFTGSGNYGSVTIRIGELKAKSRRCEEALKLFLAKYGFFSENGVIYDFSRLEDEISKREEEAKRSALASVEKENLSKELVDIKFRVGTFLAKYGFKTENLEKELSELKSALSKYEILKGEKTLAEERNAQNAQGIRISEQVVERFSQKHLIKKEILSAQSLTYFENDSRRYGQLICDMDSITSKIKSYKAEHSLTDEPMQSTDAETDTEQIEEALSAHRRTLSELALTVGDIEDRLSTLPEKQNELEACEERIAAYERRYRLISKTQELLKSADSSIVERFVGPLKKIFDEYLAQLSDTLGKKFSMDLDFNLKFESGGEMRDERHLSSGQHALVSLCLKLALTKAAFSAEEPFVIMDDPFVNLDESHIEKTREFIKKISENIQIVYFSCHNSRKI